MTEYGLQPSFVQLQYSTPFGTHSQTLPTVQWLPSSITGNMGSYVAWNSVPVDAEAMIDAMVAVLKAEIKADCSYDLATIFNYDSGINKFLPVAVKALAVAGTATGGSPRKACSQTINMRSLGGQPVKIVILDHPMNGGEFDKVSFLDFDAAALAIVAEYSDDANGWSARDNTRPAAAISATFDLNDALRRQYRMV